MPRQTTTFVPALLMISAVAYCLEFRELLPEYAVVLAGALVGAGALLGGALGKGAASLGLGCLVVLGRPSVLPHPPASIDPSRPLAVIGRVLGDWQEDQFGWRSEVRVSHLRQGREVTMWRHTVQVFVAGQRPENGRRFRGRGYLRRAGGFANLVPSSPGAWTLRIKSRRFLSTGGDREGLAGDFPLLRRRLGLRIGDLSCSRCKPLLGSLLLGQSRMLAGEHRQQLRRLGLAHLFSVSGLHVALVATLAYAVSLPFPRHLRLVVSATCVAAYVGLVGPRPAILRAAAMAAIGLASLAVNRPIRALQGLSSAVALMTAFAPDIVRAASFQLTAAATAGIVLLGPRLERPLGRLPLALRRALAASVGAQFGSAPVSWSLFGMIHPAAPILNLIAAPWLLLALGASLCWGLAAATLPSFTIGGGALDALAWPLEALSRLPPSRLLTWSTRLGQLPALAAVALFMVSAASSAQRRARLLAGLISLILVLGPRPDAAAEIVMIDVGQGDAILLRDGASAALIDGGGWTGGDIASRILLRNLAGLGIRSLEMIVVSHGDADHCQGLLDLAAYIKIGSLVSAPLVDEGQCLTRLIETKSLGWRSVTSGDEFTVGGWRVAVLHPDHGSRARGNNRSLVLRATGFGASILLTGDIEAAAELELEARHGQRLASRILKVAHHGSATSSRRHFLEAVSPSLALVSVGRGNRYGHPSPDVVHGLEGAGARVLRTDRDGMIRIRFATGTGTEIETYGPG